MKDKALKEGDYIKIVNPVFVNRFGYPLNTKIIKNEFTQEQRKKVRKFYDEFVTGQDLSNCDNVLDTNYLDLSYSHNPDGLAQVFHGLAYGILKVKDHGGPDRRLYTQEFPELKDGVSRIIRRKVVKTGKRIPGSGGYDYWGEYDYDPGYLANEKTHVLYEVGNVRVGPEEYWLSNDNYNILCETAKHGISILSMPNIPVYIEKCNVIKEELLENEK